MSRLADHLIVPAVPAALAADRRFGLTEALRERPRTAEALAADLGLDARALGLVLPLLSALGRCERRPDGAWEHTGPAPAWPWDSLETFLRTGALAVDLDQPQVRDRAYAVVVPELAQRGRAAAAWLAERLTPADEVLDIGAGAGPWSLALAARHPGVRVTALDRPEVLPRFVEAAREGGLQDRVSVLEGAFADPLPVARWDRVILGNVLHLLPAAEAADLLARAAAALRPGGDVVIVDCLPRADGLDALPVAGYALHLGLRTRRGTVHPVAALRRWCRAAGLPRSRLLRPDSEPAVGVLVASR